MFLTPAVFSAVAHPLKPTFKITPKGKKIEHEFLNPMATVFFIICLINFIGILFAVAKWYYYPLYRSVIFVAFCWCFFNTILGLITLGAFWERQQLRHYHRTKSRGTVQVSFPSVDRSVPGEIQDLSLTGIGVEFRLPLPVIIGEEVRLESTDSFGTRHVLLGRIKTRREKKWNMLLGIEFVLNETTYPHIVTFVYGDSQRWVEIAEERFRPVLSYKTTFMDLRYYLQRGIRGSVERGIYLSTFIAHKIKRYPDMLFERMLTVHPGIKGVLHDKK
jgi:cellulose synthase (UDP-forming)